MLTDILLPKSPRQHCANRPLGNPTCAKLEVSSLGSVLLKLNPNVAASFHRNRNTNGADIARQATALTNIGG